MNDVEVSGRRRRTKVAERQQWVEQFRASGLKLAEFAAQQGLRVGTVQRWIYEQGKPMAAARFAEVAWSDRGLGGSWAVEVVRPDGWLVRLKSEVAAVWLPKLLGA